VGRLASQFTAERAGQLRSARSSAAAWTDRLDESDERSFNSLQGPIAGALPLARGNGCSDGRTGDDRHDRFDHGSTTVKVHIDPERCQGHGRCYDLAPDLFGDDDEGYGTVLGDGDVPPACEHAARRAVTNCPERAIELIEEKQS
jgi:ferredoxin